MRKQRQEVLETTDYGMFKRVEGNRPINERYVTELKKEIERKNLLHVNPILVSDDYTVIDGQHRLAIAQDLGVPIYYIKVEQLGLDEIRTLNKRKKIWSLLDCAYSYAEQGLEPYQRFLVIKDKYGFSDTAVMYLLMGRSGSREACREGRFEVTEEEVKLAEERIKMVLDFSKYLPRHYGTRSFIAAMVRLSLVEGYDL